ncbi:hypothetical protein [Vibrio gazogenes]|uniref:hypothetical protein n=1 Tax=Vibrio gazogenes TaxID=687 RepID=UPI0018DEFE1C|nr:hypothetical protein [Vibrio gazogenes]
MARQQNPVRGFVRCPVCTSSSTVHQVGEGRLIETGEPPKNNRNLGLMYYRCPECGNSSISRKVNDFIGVNMVENESQLQAEARLPDPVTPLPITGEVVTDETSQDTVSEQDNRVVIRRFIMLIGVIVFIVWLIRRFMLRVKLNEVNESAGVQDATA